MTEDLRADPPKADPESLVLRAAPRAVTRISRRVVVILAALACAAMVGATWFALKAPHPRKDQGQELINTDHRQPPDGLASLPRNYGEMPPPRLGPPLPGDLGPAVLGQERSLGLSPPIPPGSGFRPNPVDDAARAEKLRLAQQARQAREAGVMVQIAHHAEAPRSAAAMTPAMAGGAGMSAADHPILDPERDPNGQQRKLDFLDRKADQGIINPHALQDLVSPYEVLAGTVIAASLITGLDSDLPGLVTAQVTENVYDTVSGTVLLIPQGARLIGGYDSVVAYGQRRALVAWRRIIMPDGSSVLIDNLPATDTAGYAGLEDGVDFHTWQLVKGIALSTLLGAGTEIHAGQESDLMRAIRQSTQTSVNQAGQRITEKNLAIQPSLTVRPGWPLRVIVHQDLVLRPYRG